MCILSRNISDEITASIFGASKGSIARSVGFRVNVVHLGYHEAASVFGGCFIPRQALNGHRFIEMFIDCKFDHLTGSGIEGTDALPIQQSRSAQSRTLTERLIRLLRSIGL